MSVSYAVPNPTGLKGVGSHNTSTVVPIKTCTCLNHSGFRIIVCPNTLISTLLGTFTQISSIIISLVNMKTLSILQE